MCTRKCYQNRTKLEICLVILSILLIIITVASLLLTPSRDNECRSETCLLSATKIRQFIDPTVDPCENFYHFVCGNFMKNYAEDRQISSPVEEQFYRTRRRLKEIANEPINSNDSNSVIIAKQFYQTCMNDTVTDKEFKETILGLIRKLGGWPLIDGSKWRDYEFNWVDMMVKSRKLGLKFNVFLEITIQHRIPKISYPTDLQEIDSKFVDYYRNLIIAIAEYFSVPGNVAAIRAAEIVDFEFKLIQVIETAQKSKFMRTALENLVDFQNKIPEINWTKLLYNLTLTETMMAQDARIFNAIEPYYTMLDDLIRQTPKTIQANYVIWKILQSLDTHFPTALRQKFDDYRLLKEKKLMDRSEVCTNAVRSTMKNVLESVYVQRAATKSLINEITDLIESIQREIKRRVLANSWMDKETKDNSINKTERTIKIIGGPDYMFDSEMFGRLYGYDKFNFESDNIIVMVNQLQSHNYQRQFSETLAADRIEGFDLEDTDWIGVNGRYHMLMNIIVLSLGILHDDFYTNNRPKYLNYGGLGQIIGHELAHGFDFFRTLYQTEHGLQPWITQRSLEEYYTKLGCLNDELHHITDLPGEANFEDNTAENLADFIGIDLTYRAYRDSIQDEHDIRLLPGLDYNANQLFWMQQSTFFCYKKLETSKWNVEQNDTHSTPMFRVLGPLRNSKYFAEDFNCPADSYMNPPMKCDLI